MNISVNSLVCNDVLIVFSTLDKDIIYRYYTFPSPYYMSLNISYINNYASKKKYIRLHSLYSLFCINKYN